MGERARLVHHLLLGGLRPHRRHLEDLPRGRKPRLKGPEADAAQRGLGPGLLAAPAGRVQHWRGGIVQPWDEDRLWSPGVERHPCYKRFQLQYTPR